MKLPIISLLKWSLYTALVGLSFYSIIMQAALLANNTLRAAVAIKPIMDYFQNPALAAYGIGNDNMGVLAFVAFVLIVALLESRGQYSTRLHYVLMALALIGAFIMALVKPFGSVDIYYYVAYGREVLLGLDPYQPLFNAMYDPVIQQVPPVWYQNPALYGPVAVAIFSLLNVFSTPEMGSLLLTFKLGWFVFFVVFATTCHILFRKSGPYPATKWMLICANPVTWMLCLRDGHVEILMLTFMALSLLALQRKSWGLAGAALGAFCSVKIVALAVVPFFFWHAFRRKEASSQSGVWCAARMFEGFILLTVPLYAYFEGGDILPVIEFSKSQLNTNSISLQVLSRIMALKAFIMTPEQTALYMRPLSALFLLSGLGALFAHFVFSRRPQNLSLAAGAAMLWLLFSLSYTLPWYILWSMFFLINGLARLSALLFVGAFYILYVRAFDYYGNIPTIIITLFGFYGLWRVLNNASLPAKEPC